MAKRSGTYHNFSHTRVPKILQNGLRMAVLAAVNRSEEVDFTSLKNAVKATDGNLSRQLKILEEAGLITANKIFVNKRPQTNLAITNKGRNMIHGLVALVKDWYDYPE